jgi:hypothetical protein
MKITCHVGGTLLPNRDEEEIFGSNQDGGVEAAMLAWRL